MEQVPLKARIGPPAQQEDDEREGGEISDTERSRERDSRNRVRDRDRDRERTLRDDVYYPSRGTYDREGRYWDRDRERERGGGNRDFDPRDDRAWTQDTGRGHPYRDSRGRRDDRERRDMDRGRDRYYGRDREREERNRRSVYERPRERDEWPPRCDRRHGDVYMAKSDSRYRPDDHRRPPPRNSPEPAFRHERERSRSRSRIEGGSRAWRRRDDSMESRHSTARYNSDDRDRRAYTPRKRERSRSPAEQDNREQRRRRTSYSPYRRRTRSPSASRREETRPERELPRRPDTESRTETARHSVPEPISQRQVARPHLSIPHANAKGGHGSPVSRNSPAPSLGAAIEKAKVVSPEATQQQHALSPTQAQSTPLRSPTKQVDIPSKAPFGPRSAGLQPPPPRLPEIPEYRGPSLVGNNLERANRMSAARLPLYAKYSRANFELYRAKLETEISAIELRSIEQRRILAEQQRQLAAET